MYITYNDFSKVIHNIHYATIYYKKKNKKLLKNKV